MVNSRKLFLFVRLSWNKKLLFLITFTLSFYALCMFRLFPKKVRFGKLTDSQPKFDPQYEPMVKLIRFAIAAVTRNNPFILKCRHEAYMAKILCRYYKIPYRIYIGFSIDENKKIKGHAWTMINQQFVTGYCNPDNYTIQGIYS